MSLPVYRSSSECPACGLSAQSSSNVIKCPACRRVYHKKCATPPPRAYQDFSRWLCMCCFSGCCCKSGRDHQRMQYYARYVHQEHDDVSTHNEPGNALANSVIWNRRRPHAGAERNPIGYDNAVRIVRSTGKVISVQELDEGERWRKIKMSSSATHKTARQNCSERNNRPPPSSASPRSSIGRDQHNRFGPSRNLAVFQMARLENGMEVSAGLESMRTWESKYRYHVEKSTGSPATHLTEAQKAIHLDRQDQQDKLRSAVIKGVPYRKNENLYEIALKIGTVLELDLQNKISSVQRRYHNGANGKQKQTERPIEITFYAIMDKRKLIEKRKKRLCLTSKHIDFQEDNAIHINEMLTARRHRLFGTMKSLKKEKNLYKIWTEDGELYMKPSKNDNIYHIQKEEDLQFLM